MNFKGNLAIDTLLDRKIESDTLDRWKKASEVQEDSNSLKSADAESKLSQIRDEKRQLSLALEDRQIERGEKELVVDPSLFYQSPSQAPKAVQSLMKKAGLAKVSQVDTQAVSFSGLRREEDEVIALNTYSVPETFQHKSQEKEKSKSIESSFAKVKVESHTTWEGREVKSALSHGTVIEGNFNFDSPVRVDGKLSGDITSSSALIVGEQGEIEGIIQVDTLIILGQVRGEIEAKNSVQIASCGSFEGVIISKNIKTEEGAKVKAKVFVGI